MKKVRKGKAARGKHRWIGLSTGFEIQSREELKLQLEQLLELVDYRLFDFVKREGESGIAIIKVSLKQYEKTRKILSEELKEYNILNSITSSGKINLVRLRMGIDVPNRARKR